MSDDSLSGPEWIAENLTIRINNYVTVAACSVVMYDTFITIAQEVKSIWTRQRSLGTWIYVFNHYLAIIYFIMPFMPAPNATRYGPSVYGAVPPISHLDCSCSVGQILIECVIVLQYVVFALFASLRVFAIEQNHRRRWPQLIVVFLLSLVPVVTNIYNYSTNVILYDSFAYCTSTFGLSPTLLFRGHLHALAAYRSGKKLGMKIRLTTTFVEDGSVYFVALIILNVFQLLNNVVPSLVLIQYSGPLISAFTPVLVSRFLLNLRQAAQNPGGEQETLPPLVADPHFASMPRITGNMGASLNTGLYDDDIDFYHDDSDDGRQGLEFESGEEIALQTVSSRTTSA